MLLLPQTSLLRALHTVVRDKNASGRDFEIYSRRIIRLLLETGLDLLPFEKREVTTPVGETYHGLEFPRRVCGVSVVRAGESMETELREMVPGIRIGKILIQRDKRTKQPELFYKHLPGDIHTGHVLLMEPMLATGGSARRGRCGRRLLGRHPPRRAVAGRPYADAPYTDVPYADVPYAGGAVGLCAAGRSRQTVSPWPGAAGSRAPAPGLRTSGPAPGPARRAPVRTPSVRPDPDRRLRPAPRLRPGPSAFILRAAEKT
nr:uracil phosphoribosyltransferase [Streptomyces nanshensis]